MANCIRESSERNPIFINPRMIENLQDSKAKATLHEGMQRDWAQVWQEGVTWRSF